MAFFHKASRFLGVVGHRSDLGKIRWPVPHNCNLTAL